MPLFLSDAAPRLNRVIQKCHTGGRTVEHMSEVMAIEDLPAALSTVVLPVASRLGGALGILVTP